MHLMINGITRKPVSRWVVRAFLETMPPLLEMTLVSGPHVVAECGGLSGWVVIAESHICVHSKASSVAVDVFSCKPFDVQIAAAYVIETFGLTNVIKLLFADRLNLSDSCPASPVCELNHG